MTTVTENQVAGAIARQRDRKAFRAFVALSSVLVVSASLWYSYSATYTVYRGPMSLIPPLRDVLTSVQTYDASYERQPTSLQTLGLFTPKFDLRPFTMITMGDTTEIVENVAIPRDLLPDIDVAASAKAQEPLCLHDSAEVGIRLDRCTDTVAARKRWQVHAAAIAGAQRQFTLTLMFIVLAGTLCAIGVARLYFGSQPATLALGTIIIMTIATAATYYFGITGGAIAYALLALGGWFIDGQRDTGRSEREPT